MHGRNRRDVKANTVRWDDNMYALYGVSRSSDVEPYSLWQRHIHPEDRERAEACGSRSSGGRQAFDPQFRIVRPDRDARTTRTTSALVRSLQGGAVRPAIGELDNRWWRLQQPLSRDAEHAVRLRRYTAVTDWTRHR